MVLHGSISFYMVLHGFDVVYMLFYCVFCCFIRSYHFRIFARSETQKLDPAQESWIWLRKAGSGSGKLDLAQKSWIWLRKTGCGLLDLLHFMMLLLYKILSFLHFCWIRLIICLNIGLTI